MVLGSPAGGNGFKWSFSHGLCGELVRLTIILEPLHFVLCALLLDRLLLHVSPLQQVWLAMGDTALYSRDPLTLGIFRFVFNSFLAVESDAWVSIPVFHSIWPNSLFNILIWMLQISIWIVSLTILNEERCISRFAAIFSFFLHMAKTLCLYFV